MSLASVFFQLVVCFSGTRLGFSSPWSLLGRILIFISLSLYFASQNVSAKLLILFSLVLFCFFTLFGACEILVFLQCFIISPRSLFISTCCLYIYSGCLSQHVFSWIFTSCFIEVIPSSILWTIIFKQYLAFPILRRFLKS